jgi:site-specific DNA recombinase
MRKPKEAVSDVAPSVSPRIVRCGIYTRKSTDEKLEHEFNSLDAQREAAEAYIASQRHDGWLTLPERYDDGGFSGGNMERPAMDRLMKDIEAGKIDCVVVYKVDRLSRSLMDFSKVMSVFEKHRVSFVSVTQHFNTTNSMGRLTLNILLSFAQFEREIISERIRDKLGAQKKKGMWAGGTPPLGYDVDRSGPRPKLVVNPDEAAKARAIFDLYLDRGSLLATIAECDQRGWTYKRRTTKKGKEVGGKPFDIGKLHAMLTNEIYIGKLPHRGQYYDAEHTAIIRREVFQSVQEQLKRNRWSGGPANRNKYNALLRGLLKCKACGRSMTLGFSGKVGQKGQVYRYYTCSNNLKRGRINCPTGSLPGSEIERVVIEQIRALGSDPELQAEVVAQAQTSTLDERTALVTEAAAIETEIAKASKQLRRAATGRANGPSGAAVELSRRLEELQVRAKDVATRTAEVTRQQLVEDDVRRALVGFDGVWTALSPKKRIRLIQLLVDQVEYDGDESTITVKFQPTGIKSLANSNAMEAA